MVRFGKWIAVVLALVLAANTDVRTSKADDDEHGKHRDRYEREHEEEHGARDTLRDAVERGNVKPLSEVLDIVRSVHEGDVVGVEVEQKGSLWVYEIRLVERSGRILEVYVDAASGQILKTEEK